MNMECVELAEQFELVDSIFLDFYQGLRFGSYYKKYSLCACFKDRKREREIRTKSSGNNAEIRAYGRMGRSCF